MVSQVLKHTITRRRSGCAFGFLDEDRDQITFEKGRRTGPLGRYRQRELPVLVVCSRGDQGKEVNILGTMKVLPLLVFEDDDEGEGFVGWVGWVGCRSVQDLECMRAAEFDLDILLGVQAMKYS